jgi:hypothetical protein
MRHIQPQSRGLSDWSQVFADRVVATGIRPELFQAESTKRSTSCQWGQDEVQMHHVM